MSNNDSYKVITKDGCGEIVEKKSRFIGQVFRVETVQEAVKIYGAPGILNSDQGSQFTSGAYKQLLASLHIRQSMDGKARWVDNIWIERWFRSLKTELIYISEFRSPRELRTAIRDYIHQYNRIRPHQSLDYAVPDDVFYSGLAA